MTGIDLLGLTIDQWGALMKEMGEKPFHSKQVFQWLHQKQAPSWETMTNIPMAIRTQLAMKYGVPSVEAIESLKDDESEKLLIKLPDGSYIEAVAIGGTKGYTGCLSTQVGCQVNCPFCASGKGGLIRNLTTGEIVGQALALKRTYRDLDHLVFMGMGEPFHNYDALLRALRILNAPEGMAFGARRITISTSGVVPEIYRLASEDLQVNLAVSLGAPDEDLRRRLIPLGQVYNLRQLLASLDYYIEKTHRRVSFEYTLLRGINDRISHADELATLARGRLVHVNLIAYNSVEKLGFETPRPVEVHRFRDRLHDKGVPVNIRLSKGSHIRAACGQLAGRQREEET